MSKQRKNCMAVTCDISEVEYMLEKHSKEWDLMGMSAYQVGIGFGAKVNVLLAFARKMRVAL